MIGCLFVCLFFAEGCFSDITGVGIGLLSLYLRWVLDPPPQVQPVDLVESAKEDAQTISVYMYILLLVTAAFLFAKTNFSPLKLQHQCTGMNLYNKIFCLGSIILLC